MSMHRKPLTALEEAGLRAHGLEIGKPSQLSDVFRHGVAYALVNAAASEPAAPVDARDALVKDALRAAAEGFREHVCFVRGSLLDITVSKWERLAASPTAATREGEPAAPVDARLLDIAQRLSLATDECGDKAEGTHYIDKQGVIRCKGSFLALIADARAAIARQAAAPAEGEKLYTGAIPGGTSFD